MAAVHMLLTHSLTHSLTHLLTHSLYCFRLFALPTLPSIFSSMFPPSSPQVVFGKVKQGLDIVTAIEAVGSQGGETSKTVTIVDCGELPLGGASS